MEDEPKKGPVVFAFRRHRLVKPAGNGQSKRKIPVIRIAAAVMVIALASGLVVYLRREKPVLIVGTQKIYKQQYDQLVSQAKRRQINAEGANTQIIRAYKILEVAKKLKITLDDSATDLSKSISSNAYDGDEFGKLMSRAAYVESYIATTNRDGYEGYVFFYPFSRHFLNSAEKPDDPEFNNVSAIAKDQKAAKEKAENARKDLEQGKTTPEEIVKAIKSDTSLVYGSASNKSGKFRVDTEAYPLNNSVIDASMTVGKYFSLLGKMKEGEISAIRDDIQQYLDTQTKKPITRNTAYYFVTKTKNLNADKNYASQYNNELKQVKVTNDVQY